MGLTTQCEHGNVAGFDGERYLRLIGERWVKKGGSETTASPVPAKTISPELLERARKLAAQETED